MSSIYEFDPYLLIVKYEINSNMNVYFGHIHNA